MTHRLVLIERPDLDPASGVAERALGERLDRLAALDPAVPGRDRRLDDLGCRRTLASPRSVNGRGDASDAADTNVGAVDVSAVNPAATQRANPENIVSRGSRRRGAPPRASPIAATIDTTIAAHSTQATIEQRPHRNRRPPRSSTADGRRNR